MGVANWHDSIKSAIQSPMLILFFLVMAIGSVSPLFQSARITALASCACLLIATMAYSYITSTPETLGLGASTSNRREALVIIACEFTVLVLALLSPHRSKILFWLGWATHTLLTILCTVVVICFEFFWHW